MIFEISLFRHSLARYHDLPILSTVFTFPRKKQEQRYQHQPGNEFGDGLNKQLFRHRFASPKWNIKNKVSEQFRIALHSPPGTLPETFPEKHAAFQPSFSLSQSCSFSAIRREFR